MSDTIIAVLVFFLLLTINFLDGYGDGVLLRGKKIFGGLLKNGLVFTLFFGVAHCVIQLKPIWHDVMLVGLVTVLVRIGTFYIFHNLGAGLKWHYIGRLKWYDRGFWWMLEKSPVKYLKPQPWAILSVISIASILFAIQLLRFTFHFIPTFF